METIYLPFLYWMGFTGSFLVLGILAGLRFALSKKKSHQGPKNHLISEKSLPSAGMVAGKTFFSRWDARCKIFSLLLFILFVIITDNLVALLIQLAFALFVFVFSRMPAGVLLRRVAAVIPFLSFLAFFLIILSPPGRSKISVVFEPFGPIILNRDALITSARICLKTITVVSVMPLMIDTSPYAETILALRSIGVPESIAQLLLLAYRYIFVFRDEALRMHRAMVLRGFTPRSDLRTAKISGNFVAMIFVRSYERTQRIRDAMIARGYRGKMPHMVSFRMSFGDVAIALMWVFAGVAGWIFSLIRDH